MALDNLQIDYLIDPAFQIENLAGKPAVGGHVEVFEAGTDTKVITYQDFDGNVNPFKIPLHSDGRAVILADPSRKYDFYVYDSFNNLMFSRLNVTPNLSGNISIKGSDVYIYNTDGTLDITQQSIQNNIRRYEINTKHKSLGVEAPLYFVEDSDTATIIGFSGDDYATKDYVDSAVSSKLDISSYSSQSGDFLTDKFEYDDDNHITAYNHSAFAAGAGSGTIYEAGDHIDITDNVISVTGLPTSSDVENAISSAVTNVENKFEYNENNYITAYNNSAFAGKEYSAGDGISIVNDVISVTSQGGGIEQVSHDDTLSGNGNSEPLGIANAEDYVKQDDLTGYATTALVSSVSSELYSAFSGISGDFELVAGEGVELVDDPNAKTTTINVTAEGTPVTAIEQMIESATSGISAAISGSYTLVAGSGIQLTDDDNARTTTVSVSGDYLSATESANYYPMTGNPSGFLTAHQDLSDYATTAELANKLDTTAFSDVSGSFLTAHQDISNKLDTTAFSDVSGSFLTAVPDTYLQNTDLTLVDNKITEISGIPLSAGDELPSGVMNTSALEYNAVNEISGYNGSAIAQYGAEKQWLVHDDTLVHASNSTQYALGVNMSAVAQLLGVDETVLYSGTQTYSAILSESVKNFDKILIEYGPNNYSNVPAAIFFTDKFVDNNAIGGGVHLEFIEHNGTNGYCFPKSTTFVWHNNFTNLDAIGGIQYRVSGNAIQNELTGNQLYIRKIVGIGRKQ